MSSADGGVKPPGLRVSEVLISGCHFPAQFSGGEYFQVADLTVRLSSHLTTVSFLRIAS